MLSVKLNGRRAVSGVLRGFDQFMNLVIEETQEIIKDDKKIPCGTVVTNTITNYHSAVILMFPSYPVSTAYVCRPLSSW